MKIKNKLAVFLSALLVSFSSSATAFEGFSIGATYSSIDYASSGSERTTAAGGNAGVITNKSVSGSDDIGSLFAEYTFSQGSTIGIEAISGEAEIGKATSNARSSVISSKTNATVTAKATAKDPMTLYVEPTWMANEKFGIYLKGGVTSVTISPSETDANSMTTSTYKDKDLYGLMTGIGAKYYVGNFFLKAEYVETDFDTYSHVSTTGTGNTITADIDTEETKLSIGYNF
jgi:hypothetical protein